MIDTKSIAKKAVPLALGRYYNTLNLVAPERAASKAFDLFCTPRAGQIREKDVPFLERAEQLELLTESGLRIQAYNWQGKSDKRVLLLHGWQSNAGRWRRLGPILEAQGFTVTAIDAPAHGQSSGPFFNVFKYAEAIDALTQQMPVHHLIGHSIGGMAASYFLTHFDFAQIEKLVLLGAPSDMEDIAMGFNRTLRLNRATQESLRRHFIQEFGRPVSYFSIASFCKEINQPTLVIHDKHDPFANVRDAYRYEQALKQSEMMITEKLGHDLQHESVYHAIAGFLDKKSD